MRTARRTSPSAPIRPARIVAAALASAAAVVALTGCSGYVEATCGGGEYPVMTVGGTGSACVKDSEAPPKGYTRYPEGKVPKHVDDKWDVYWRTHTLDKNGDIIDAPEEG